MSAVHIMFMCFIPFMGTMNLTYCPAPNIRVFIAQLVEHCCANAEAMGSNPVEALKTIFGLNCDCLNRDHNCDDHTFISFVYVRSSHNVHRVVIRFKTRRLIVNKYAAECFYACYACIACRYATCLLRGSGKFLNFTNPTDAISCILG